jgi:hypothetical protein
VEIHEVNKAVLKTAAKVNKLTLFLTSTTTATTASETCMARNGRDCGRNRGLAITVRLVAELCKFVKRI